MAGRTECAPAGEVLSPQADQCFMPMLPLAGAGKPFLVTRHALRLVPVRSDDERITPPPGPSYAYPVKAVSGTAGSLQVKSLATG